MTAGSQSYMTEGSRFHVQVDGVSLGRDNSLVIIRGKVEYMMQVDVG